MKKAITKNNLTDFHGVGDAPTAQELETQVITDNSNYQAGDAIFSDITNNNALATANPDGKYGGNINLTYIYNKKTVTETDSTKQE